MNNDRDRDKKFDDFDPNKNQNQQGDGERNNFFRARGGHTYTGQFYNYGDRQRYQNQRGGGYNNMRGGDRPNFNVRGNPHFYGGGRGGYNNNYKSSCGTITITSGVTSVTATKGGTDAPNSIGAGYRGTCGSVTIETGANVTQN